MARIDPPAVESAVTCNIVPLLDVMFLLLLFLMVGSDMSHAEAAQLDLPKASEARTPVDAPDRRVVVLNVSHRESDACADHTAGRRCEGTAHWTYSMQGLAFGGDVLADRLAVVAEDATEPDAGIGRRLSAVTLSIRCDRVAPYGLVQDVLAACAAARIHRTEVAASMPSK